MSTQPARIRTLLDQLDERLNWASNGTTADFCNRHARVAQRLATALRQALGLPAGR